MSRPDPDREAEVIHEVLYNDMLREHILNFVIQNKGKVSYVLVRTCRRVNSSWRSSISNCLLKLRKPLFSLHLPPISKRKTLKRFTAMGKRIARRERYLPPTRLVILADYLWERKQEYFQMDNFEDVTAFLARHGSRLVSLFLQIPEYGFPDSEGEVFSFNFPFLQSLNVNLGHTNNELNDWSLMEEEAYGGNAHASKFVRALISACGTLKNFTLSGGATNCEHIPQGMDDLGLPGSLKKLEVDRSLLSERLETLIKFTVVPQLSTLTLAVPLETHDDNLIFKILTTFSQTLKHLTLKDIQEEYMGDSPQETLVQLPPMEALETLGVFYYNMQFPPGGLAAEIQNKLPSLKTLQCRLESHLEFFSKVESFRCESLRHVQVMLENSENGDSVVDASSYVLDTVVIILDAFPNIVKLDLTFNLAFDITGLQYVFQNFGRLKDLRINITTGVPPDNFEHAWNDLLLGTSEGVVKTMEEAKGSWDDFRIGNDDLPAISNMTELESLHLSLSLGTLLTPTGEYFPPVNCDALFHFGLWNMPNLREVHLLGRFEVSLKMAEMWKETGRLVRYNVNNLLHLYSCFMEFYNNAGQRV